MPLRPGLVRRADEGAEKAKEAHDLRAVSLMQNGTVHMEAAAGALGRAARRLRTCCSDVIEGALDAATIAGAFLTPFLREERCHWGVCATLARRTLPGDDLIPLPRWRWTHGVEIDAPTDAVWPWIAGAGEKHDLHELDEDRVRAKDGRQEWEVQPGQHLRLHPRLPAMPVVLVIPQRALVAFTPADAVAKRSGKSWSATSWLFYVEPLGTGRCRFVSRYRCACSDEVLTGLQFGPTMLEPIGFALDRRMLVGVKRRAERTRSSPGRGLERVAHLYELRPATSPASPSARSFLR
jgi:hypothetical protein